MSTQLIDLTTTAALDHLLASSTGPILIYKHSLTCGASAAAYEELLDLLAAPGFDLRVGLVHVQIARPVSNEIARRFRLRHESPQVLLLQDGALVWQASHYAVTAEAMATAIENLSPL